MNLKKIRQIAEKFKNPDAVTFCDVALGDLEGAIITLIENSNNISQLVKLLGFCEDTQLHQRGAKMLLHTDPDAYFGSYLPQSWRRETLEHACNLCDGEHAARLCRFVYDVGLFDFQCAADFCFNNDPQSENLSLFIPACDPTPLLQLTNRSDLRVALLARAGEFQAAISACTPLQFDTLVDSAVRAHDKAFALQVVLKVRESEKFDVYLGKLKDQLSLSQLIRVCAACGFAGGVVDAIAESVERIEAQLAEHAARSK